MIDLNFGLEPQEESRVNDALAASAIDGLVEMRLLPAGARFDPERFRECYLRVQERFRVAESSITTRMARMLHAIAGSSTPRTVLAIGTAAGNALVWLRAGAPGSARVIGVDTDPGAIALARQNFQSVGLGDVILQCADGHDAAKWAGGPVDLLLLDADDPIAGKRIYRSLLEALWPNLSPGALILAHDAAHPPFEEALGEYWAAVRDPSRFRATATLEIDRYGLEVTLR